jgi:uncharacterized membrane protein YeaQ/YmgE (transglycosylase-associated protein family)
VLEGAMEEFFQGVGITALILLALVGAGLGAAAAKLLRRPVVLYVVVGALAAMATPFVLAALGVTVLAAGGILLVLIVGAVGAAVAVALVRALTGRR